MGRNFRYSHQPETANLEYPALVIAIDILAQQRFAKIMDMQNRKPVALDHGLQIEARFMERFVAFDNVMH